LVPWWLKRFLYDFKKKTGGFFRPGRNPHGKY
jgi:hypothetical protein